MHDHLRRLLGDHALQTANVIAALGVVGEADLDPLLVNARELGALLGAGYSVPPRRFVELLTGHANMTAAYLGHLRRNEQVRAAAIERSWEHNGEDIARALVDADSELRLSDIRQIVREHLDLVRAQATAFYRGDRDGAFQAYERDRDQMLALADLLAEASEPVATAVAE